MKLTIIFCIGLFSATQLIAQGEQVRKLKNYPRNSSISIFQQQCILSNDKQVDSLPIIKDGENIWHAKNKNDNDKIKQFEFSNENISDLKMQYDTLQNKKYLGLPLLEQLMNRASDKGGIIKFVNEKNGESASNETNNIITDNNVINPIDETDLLPKENKNSDVIIYSLAGLLALISGLFIKEKLKGNKKHHLSIHTEPASPNNSIADVQAQIIQLQTTNSSLMAQIKELEMQYKNYKDADAAYFENALTTLVNPAKNAMLKQQKSETLALAMQILIQYIAITHTKTNRRQGSDDYVIKSMKGEALTAQEAKQNIISSNTVSDAIPNEFKTMMEILKENKVNIPLNLSYMGYQMQS